MLNHYVQIRLKIQPLSFVSLLLSSLLFDSQIIDLTIMPASKRKRGEDNAHDIDPSLAYVDMDIVEDKYGYGIEEEREVHHRDIPRDQDVVENMNQGQEAMGDDYVDWYEATADGRPEVDFPHAQRKQVCGRS